jgi:hypothetical protein
MKILSKPVKWLQDKYRQLYLVQFKTETISEVPSVVSKQTVFIIKDGAKADSLVFKCPCGCDADIYLNLLKDTRPNWNYYITRGKITISPSVWRTIGCESHFFIQGSKIVWMKSKHKY